MQVFTDINTVQVEIQTFSYNLTVKWQKVTFKNLIITKMRGFIRNYENTFYFGIEILKKKGVFTLSFKPTRVQDNSFNKNVRYYALFSVN